MSRLLLIFCLFSFKASAFHDPLLVLTNPFLKEEYKSLEEFANAIRKNFAQKALVRDELVVDGWKIIWYTKDWYPTRTSTSYFVCIVNKNNSVSVIDYGFFERTKDSTNFGVIEYDKEKQILLYKDSYKKRLMGGKYFKLPNG